MIQRRILFFVVLMMLTFLVTASAARADINVLHPVKSITITSPLGGHVLHSGNHIPITWNYTGKIGSTLFLNLVHLSGDPAGHGLFNVVIVPEVMVGSGGHGSYDWVVPDVPTGYTYTVQISSTNASTSTGSQKFTIVNPKQQPTIKVTSPNGGESWYKGQTHNITWTHVADPGQKVIITLVPSSDPVKFIKLGEGAAGVNGSGSFSWKIGTDVEYGKDYQVWVGNSAYNAIFIDHSDTNFTVAKLLTVRPGTSIAKPKISKIGERDQLDPQPEPPMYE